MAAFAALLVHPALKPARLGKALHLADELIPPHLREYRTFLSEMQPAVVGNPGATQERAGELRDVETDESAQGCTTLRQVAST